MCERPTSACRRPAARRLLLGWDAGAEQSSCWFLASKPPIELRGAGVAGCRDSIPAWFNRAAHDEIETRGAGIRQGELQRAAGGGMRAGKGGTAAGGGSRSRSGGRQAEGRIFRAGTASARAAVFPRAADFRRAPATR